MEIQKLDDKAKQRLQNFKELKDKDGNELKNQTDVQKAYSDLDEAISQCRVVNMSDELFSLFCDAIKAVRES